MIVKSDQDRVRALLTEAITVLCRKRLSFKSQLSVEGLIGITLDSDDIFLVSIKELVLNSSGEESLAEPPTSVQGSTPAMMDSAKVRSGRQRKSTPRHLSVVSPPLHYDINFPVEEEEEECNWQLQDGTDIDDLSPVTNLFHRAEIQRDGNQLRGLVAKDEPLEYRVREENGIDAPLNLSNTSSSHAASPRVRVNPDEKPHRDITPQKRKRNDSDDTDSQCSSVVSASAKRPSSISSISCPSPAYRTTPTLELVTIKQEPNIESASINNNHHHFDPAPTNGYVFVQPAQEDAITKGFSNGVMKDTGNILAGRTNLIESAIWQRLASPITPLQLSSPMMPSQDMARLVENGDATQKQCDPLPVQKAPLYSITGKLKKENKPATEKIPAKETTNLGTPDKLPVNKENGNNNLAPNAVLDLEKKNMLKKLEVKVLSKVNVELNQRAGLEFLTKSNLDFNTKNNLEFNNKANLEFTHKANYDLNKANLEFSRANFELNKANLALTKANFDLNHKTSLDAETLDKLDHSYADVSAASEGSLDHSDGYHSLRMESPDQENMEVYSVDSDDDVKTEDFIDRRQEPGKAISYKCKLCERVYSNKWNCRRHIQYTHMNKTGFTCEICHNKYRDRSDYQEHLQVIHQGPGGYKCDFCDKILMSKRSLKEHVSLHTGQYRYHCIECSRGFNRLNDYQLHMTKDHGANIATVTTVEMAQMLEEASKKVVQLPQALPLQTVKDPADFAVVASPEVAQIIEDAAKKITSETMAPLPIVD